MLGPARLGGGGGMAGSYITMLKYSPVSAAR